MQCSINLILTKSAFAVSMSIPIRRTIGRHAVSVGSNANASDRISCNPLYCIALSFRRRSQSSFNWSKPANGTIGAITPAGTAMVANLRTAERTVFKRRNAHNALGSETRMSDRNVTQCEPQFSVINASKFAENQFFMQSAHWKINSGFRALCTMTVRRSNLFNCNA